MERTPWHTSDRWPLDFTMVTEVLQKFERWDGEKVKCGEGWIWWWLRRKKFGSLIASLQYFLLMQFNTHRYSIGYQRQSGWLDWPAVFKLWGMFYRYFKSWPNRPDKVTRTFNLRRMSGSALPTSLIAYFCETEMLFGNVEDIEKTSRSVQIWTYDLPTVSCWTNNEVPYHVGQTETQIHNYTRNGELNEVSLTRIPDPLNLLSSSLILIFSSPI